MFCLVRAMDQKKKFTFKKQELVKSCKFQPHQQQSFIDQNVVQIGIGADIDLFTKQKWRDDDVTDPHYSDFVSVIAGAIVG